MSTSDDVDTATTDRAPNTQAAAQGPDIALLGPGNEPKRFFRGFRPKTATIIGAPVSFTS